MSSKYLEVEVGDRGTILVDVTPKGGVFPVGGKEDVIKRAEGAFESAMGTIRTCAEGFVSHIAEFADAVAPQEVNLEFGVLFKAEGGTVVTKAGGEAHFKVSLTWKEAKAT